MKPQIELRDQITTTVAIVIVAKWNADQYRELIDAAVGRVDEIITAVDDGAEVGIDNYRPDMVKYLHRPLNADFAAQRNFLADAATSDWILAIDTDENLTPFLWQSLRLLADATLEDTISLPMRHTVGGKPDFYQWPAYALRMWRKNGSILWTRPIHTYLTGFSSTRLLPPILRYAIQHTKTAEMQQRTDLFNAAHPIPQ